MRQIEDEASAARLLAACDIVTENNFDCPESLEVRQYVYKEYANTQVVQSYLDKLKEKGASYE